MTSKAEKLRAKRGRPKLPRSSTGRIGGRKSRRKADVDADNAETQRQAMQTVVDARTRHEANVTGEILTPEQARNPLRGSVLGLMLLDQTINHTQFKAGQRYAETKWRYHALTGIAFPNAQAQKLFAVHGWEGEPTESRQAATIKASNRMMEMDGWISRIGPDHQHIRDKLNRACFSDEEQARLWPEYTMKYLLRGLNELIFRFGLDNKPI